MTRVLHVHSGNLFGGVETFLLTLARYAGSAGAVEHHFAVCFPGPLREALEGLGAPVHPLVPMRLSRPWSVPRGRMALRSVIQRERIDVVVMHSVWIQALLGPTARRSGRPVAVWMHDAPGATHWTAWLAQRVRPDRLVCNSNFTASNVGQIYDSEPCLTVALPVAWPPAEFGAREAVRAEMGVGADCAVILLASRLDALKGHSLLFAALARLGDLSQWQCWIAGAAQRPSEREYFARLLALADEYGISSRVRFMGHRTDMGRILAAADIYCQPNLGPETFGISFVEAMYAGLPVVTTPLGAAPEIVVEDTGILARGEPEAVASALRGLIGDRERRERLGRAGRERAKEMCEPARQVEAISSLLAAMARD